MAILDIVQDVATAVGLERPMQVFGASSREMVEMQATINRSAKMVRDECDWQALTRIGAVQGDGASEAFSLPADYLRMAKDADIWTSNRPSWPAERVLSVNVWLDLTMRNLPAPYGQWALFGGKIHYRPTLGAADTLKFAYVTRNSVVADDGVEKAAYSADTDEFLLSDKLLELCIIYNWKAGKGQAYAKELDDYETALVDVMDADKGSKPVVSGNNGHGNEVDTAFPYRASDAS